MSDVHEPECQTGVCICVELRTAYHRGRDDAAQDVQHVIDYAFKSAGIMQAFIKRSDAIQAAKGE